MGETGKRMTVSIAMATYNGARYITEQMESILRQTVRPDEIVVSDDGSTDETVEIVRGFIARERDVRIVLLTDNPRHGVCGNFEWAMKHTRGDLLMLCDQDDVWMPDKVERIAEIFAEHDDAALVCHDADLINQDGQRFEGMVLVEKFNGKAFHCPEGDTVRLDRMTYLDIAVRYTLTYGMTMCFRSSALEGAYPVPDIYLNHDYWLAIYALTGGNLYFTNQFLASHRLHGENASGVDPKYREKRFREAMKPGREIPKDYYIRGNCVRRLLEQRGLTDCEAYRTACDYERIGRSIDSAVRSGRLTGSVKMLILALKDFRSRRWYRRKNWLRETGFVLLNARRARRAALDKKVFW